MMEIAKSYIAISTGNIEKFHHTKSGKIYKSRKIFDEIFNEILLEFLTLLIHTVFQYDHDGNYREIDPIRAKINEIFRSDFYNLDLHLKNLEKISKNQDNYFTTMKLLPKRSEKTQAKGRYLSEIRRMNKMRPITAITTQRSQVIDHFFSSESIL